MTYRGIAQSIGESQMTICVAGCVSFEGMGFRYNDQSDDRYEFIYDDVNQTSNNGLAFAIAIMEEIYTNPEYPYNTGMPGPKTANTPKLPGATMDVDLLC